MKREIFTFDHRRMEFRKVTHDVWYVLSRILKYFLITASLAVVYYIIFSLFVSTDSQKQIKRQNQMYGKMYDDMLRKEELVGDVISGMNVKDGDIYRQLFDTDIPVSEEAGVDGLLSAEDSIHNKDIVDYTSRKLDYLESEAARIESNFSRLMDTLSGKSKTVPPMTSPIESFSFAKTGASVGEKINPFYKVQVNHGGLDMISQMGEPVHAAADGTVSEITRSAKGLGNVVEITHEGGYRTRYAHLDNITVGTGQHVSLGTVIGHVGVSGNSFAPHLHYEVLRDSLRLDPVNFFFASASPDDYAQMLFMAANAGQSMD